MAMQDFFSSIKEKIIHFLKYNFESGLVSIKKILLYSLPVLFGFFLVWWSLSGLSVSDRKEIINALQNANLFWVFLSLFLGFLSHLFRAFRWSLLLNPLGYKPKMANNIFSIFIAYLVNLAIPRAGEVARATAISKYEAIPFEKSFGTIVTERVVDVILLLAIIIIALFYQYDLIKDLLLSKIPDQPIYYIFGIGVLFLIVLFSLFILKRSKYKAKIKKFVLGFVEGLKSIFHLKKAFLFIIYSILIWVMYILMFYVTTFAFPSTSGIQMGAVITGFVVGALSIAATNGGLGTYPLGVQQVFILYGISANQALVFGWMMWSAQTFMILIFGALSFLLLPLYNKKFLQ